MENFHLRFVIYHYSFIIHHYKMHASIQKNWDSLEAKRLALFAKLDKIPPSVLDKKPAPDKWSVNQTMLHLIDAEAASLQYIQKKMSFGTSAIPKAGFRAAWRRFLLRIIFWLPLKFKAPAHLASPPDTLDYAELRQQWATQRADYQRLLASLDEKLIGAELWKHAIAGKMSIVQMLDFFEDHFDRHRGQAELGLRLYFCRSL
jgi:uncharacterized damage-inducible protein DinB